MRNLKLILATLLSVLGANAYAGGLVDLTYGQLDIKATSKTPTKSSDDGFDKTTDMGLHGLYSLNKAVGIGLVAIQRDIALTSEGKSAFGGSPKFGGMIYGPEFRLAYDAGKIKPYLRGAYVIGSYDLSTTVTAPPLAPFDATLTFDTSGWAAGIGLDIPLGNTFALMVEYGMGEENLIFKESKVGSVTVKATDDSGDLKFSMSGAIVGLGLRFN